MEKMMNKNEYYRQLYHRRIKGQTNTENNYKPWTPEELHLLMNSNLTARELSKLIGRSIMAIYCKRRFYEQQIETDGVRKKYTRITEEEKKFIRENYGILSGKEIAKALKIRLSTLYGIVRPSKNKDSIKRSKENFLKKNPDYYNNYNKKYYELNKERIMEYRRKVKLKKKSNKNLT